MGEPRLRGNTFIALLLRAGVQELSEKPEWGENNNGITRPNMFADLLRMTQPEYNPPKMKSLSSYFSRYLKGDLPSSPMYFAFNTTAYQQGLSMRISENYPAVLAEMDRFYRTYLRTSIVDRKLLVGGLVDAILADSTFDGIFDTGSKRIRKNELDAESNFIIQPFLVSVWNTILSDYPDASEGADTYIEWTDEIAYNKPRETTTQIGAERAKKIAVNDTLSEVVMLNAAEEYIEEIKKDPADKAEPEVLEGVVLDDNQEEIKEQTLNNNGRIYQQHAEKIVNIEHVETLYI